MVKLTPLRHHLSEIDQLILQISFWQAEPEKVPWKHDTSNHLKISGRHRSSYQSILTIEIEGKCVGIHFTYLDALHRRLILIKEIKEKVSLSSRVQLYGQCSSLFLSQMSQYCPDISMVVWPA
uniref:Uncharacterized protein n=1 Tax=Micrurus corallinus TaxID=54390 RepID=A0A2D4G110_MICCO